jgi:hypothetical protein
MFSPVTLLLHGQILAAIPALFLLGLAALLFAFLVKGKTPKHNGLTRAAVSLVAIGCGLLGLFFLMIFLDEFRYWVKYSF